MADDRQTIDELERVKREREAAERLEALRKLAGQRTDEFRRKYGPWPR